jgi:hypothetical protein
MSLVVAVVVVVIDVMMRETITAVCNCKSNDILE